MSLRIVHTADNHIGLSFHQYPEAVRERLVEERFASLERMVANANERDAHFFVVAGDLFDKTTVTKGQIERVADAPAEPSWELRLAYRGKASGVATTRQPMIEIAAFSEDMFQQDISFNLVAIGPSGETVGTAASSDFTDKNTGYVALRTGQTAKIPLRLAEEFNGSFEVRAQDTETNKYLGNVVKMETQILE